VVDGLVALDEVGAGQLGHDTVDRLGEHLGVAVADRALDDPFLQVPDRVGQGDLAVAGEHRRELLVGRGELDDREVLAVGVEPLERRADAALDAPHRIGFVADRLLLPASAARGSTT
jgi:hypothetical protein